MITPRYQQFAFDPALARTFRERLEAPVDFSHLSKEQLEAIVEASRQAGLSAEIADHLSGQLWIHATKKVAAELTQLYQAGQLPGDWEVAVPSDSLRAKVVGQIEGLLTGVGPGLNKPRAAYTEANVAAMTAAAKSVAGMVKEMVAQELAQLTELVPADPEKALAIVHGLIPLLHQSYREPTEADLGDWIRLGLNGGEKSTSMQAAAQRATTAALAPFQALAKTPPEALAQSIVEHARLRHVPARHLVRALNNFAKLTDGLAELSIAGPNVAKWVRQLRSVVPQLAPVFDAVVLRLILDPQVNLAAILADNPDLKALVAEVSGLSLGLLAVSPYAAAADVLRRRGYLLVEHPIDGGCMSTIHAPGVIPRKLGVIVHQPNSDYPFSLGAVEGIRQGEFDKLMRIAHWLTEAKQGHSVPIAPEQQEFKPFPVPKPDRGIQP